MLALGNQHCKMSHSHLLISFSVLDAFDFLSCSSVWCHWVECYWKTWRKERQHFCAHCQTKIKHCTSGEKNVRGFMLQQNVVMPMEQECQDTKQFSTALSAVANVGKVWCACGCAPFPVGGSLVLECILLPQLLCVTSFCESFF